MTERAKRRYDRATPDQRDEFCRDRDRVLYCSSFRRLAGVTQVVGSHEGHVYHNRLTHSLKVAQISRRLAEHLLQSRGKRMRLYPILSPDVCETAALAHDLGHPPFGHVAEKCLDRLVRRHDPDGFEGNAQSFRILVRLAAHRASYPGLDLTRASLAAVLKYSRLRDLKTPGPQKFGAYRTELEDFHFATEGRSWRPSLEAQVMDYADEMAYSVHDLEDFLRAGLLPLDRVNTKHGFRKCLDDCCEAASDHVSLMRRHESHLRGLVKMLAAIEYDGTLLARASLRSATSVLIGRYFRAARLRKVGPRVDLSPESGAQAELTFLQMLTRVYVIDNPRLATQQAGEREIIEFLYQSYREAALHHETALLPARLGHFLRGKRKPSLAEAARLAADAVASHTDQSALAAYRRLRGISIGSVHDRIV